jgi:hypothetical protein
MGLLVDGAWREDAFRAKDGHFVRAATLSSETKCNTPADLIIGTVDQDLRECCHAMLFAFVG